MKVFFNKLMSVDSGGFSPSGSKPAAVVADWIQQRLDVQIVDFKPATEADLCLAHDPKFVRGVLSRRFANGHGNRRKSVTESCRWTVGSMVAASRQALIDGITCSPSSGFHHACYRDCGAFCTLNGLLVAAQTMFAEQLAGKIGIIDCDFHYGNGSQNIIDNLDLHDRVKHWTFGRDYDRRQFRQSDFLDSLNTTLHDMRSDGCGLILFQAGADMSIADPLGGLATTEELRERDRFVFATCKKLGMPVAWTLSGGYARDDSGGIGPVIDLHRATMEEGLQVFTKA